jgi:hypothetical protein
VLKSEGLGPLNSQAKSPVPEELGEDTDGAGDTEEDSVVAVLGEAVVHEEDTAVGVDVGVRVLGLTVLGEDTRDDLVDRGDDLEQGVVGEVLLAELTLGNVPRVGLAEDSVAVTGDDLAALEGIPSELLDSLVVNGQVLGLELGLEVQDPAEHLLVGKAVEGASKTAHGGGEREVRVREGRADETSGVGRDVATLVVAVDGEVEPHDLVEGGAVEAEHTGKVGRVVELGVILGRALTTVEAVAVDDGGSLREPCNEVENVLKSGLPVLGLVDAVLVGAGELAVRLHGEGCSGELGHGVHLLGQAVEEGLDVGRELGAGVELLGDALGLGGSGDLTGHQEPEETLGEGLTTSLGGRENLLELGDGVTPEADALVGVEEGGVPEHALDITGTTDGLRDSDIAEGLLSVLGHDLLELGLLLGKKLHDTVAEALQSGKERDRSDEREGTM